MFAFIDITLALLVGREEPLLEWQMAYSRDISDASERGLFHRFELTRAARDLRPIGGRAMRLFRSRASCRRLRAPRGACPDHRDARLYRKGPGKEARLCFIGHALM